MPEITVTTRKVIPVGSFNCELIMGNATDTSGGTFKVFSLSDIYATFAPITIAKGTMINPRTR
jgi:hypothetical protein